MFIQKYILHAYFYIQTPVCVTDSLRAKWLSGDEMITPGAGSTDGKTAWIIAIGTEQQSHVVGHCGLDKTSTSRVRVIFDSSTCSYHSLPSLVIVVLLRTSLLYSKHQSCDGLMCYWLSGTHQTIFRAPTYKNMK